MITSPTVSVLRNSTNPAWESGSSGEKGAVKIRQLSVHNFVSPADPSRQASRLPIKVLKMLTARAGHILHPEYLQPLPSTPISPIEVRAEKTFAHLDTNWLEVKITGHQSRLPSLSECLRTNLISYWIFYSDEDDGYYNGGKTRPQYSVNVT